MSSWSTELSLETRLAGISNKNQMCMCFLYFYDSRDLLLTDCISMMFKKKQVTHLIIYATEVPGLSQVK
ncbi:hypothetical protein MHYP_G00008390 [Metynnis hypsauchen]